MHSNNYTLKSKWEGLSYPTAFVVRLWAQPQPPMAPWNLPRGNKCEETGFALDITQPWEQLESLGFLGLEGREGRRGCWVRKREREGGEILLAFDSEQKLLLQHWLEICNQLKSGKVFWIQNSYWNTWISLRVHPDSCIYLNQGWKRWEVRLLS